MMDIQKMIRGHNLTFFNEMIDLKLAGWNSYSKALDAYTMHQYSDQLKQLDSIIENLGESMKNVAKSLS